MIKFSELDMDEVENWTEFQAFKFIFFKSELAIPIWVSVFFIFLTVSLLWFSISNYKHNVLVKNVEEAIVEAQTNDRRIMDNIEKINTTTVEVVRDYTIKERRIVNKRNNTKKKISESTEIREMIVAVNDYYTKAFKDVKKPPLVKRFEEEFTDKIFVSNV